jgi:hypothetical protein
MLAICENECLSVYLGETQIIDNQGGQLVGTTQRVIGTINVIRSSCGVQHPESVVFHQGRAWWWDSYMKRVLRYDPNGIRNISYKEREGDTDGQMRSYFYTKTGVPVMGYDPFHNLLFVGFKGEDKMVSFDENRNQWRSFYNFMPDWMSKVDDHMISFKESVYRSNSDVPAIYFGEQQEGKYEFPIQYPSPHLLNVISLYIGRDMVVWQDGREILTDTLHIEAVNDEGQETDLQASDFDVLEGVAYAHFFRDANTGLLDGDEMRSDVHIISVTLSDNAEIETIIINETKSSGHL